MTNASELQDVLITPKALIKTYKDILKAHDMFDQSAKIGVFHDKDVSDQAKETSTETQELKYYLPVKDTPSVLDLLRSLGIQDCRVNATTISRHLLPLSQSPMSNSLGDKGRNGDRWTNPLVRTIYFWFLQTHQADIDHSGQDNDISMIIEAFLSRHWTYMIYPPLLLLPHDFLSQVACGPVKNIFPEDYSALFALLCKTMKVTHIALNAPIPARIQREPSLGTIRDKESPEDASTRDCSLCSNTKRSPIGLIPIYGDFGPLLPAEHNPTKRDFASVFWCTALQNGILQTWAPLYTMFSRGNLSEKARILYLNALTYESLRCMPEDTSAVDLYAGIGYFAFSYAKAGVGKVLCWEINPWSVEGLRRGALKNKWSIRTIMDGEIFENADIADHRLLAFSENNENAARRVERMRNHIPPVRHVNCGFLPSSRNSWATAVQVLDRGGGWIHAHENIAKKDIGSRQSEILEDFTRLVKDRPQKNPGRQWTVECEYTEEVKSYAPGIAHYVFDISIAPVDLS